MCQVKILYVNNPEPVFEGLVDNIVSIVDREREIIKAESGANVPKVLLFMAVDNAELKAATEKWLRERFGTSVVVSIEDGKDSD